MAKLLEWSRIFSANKLLANFRDNFEYFAGVERASGKKSFDIFHGFCAWNTLNSDNMVDGNKRAKHRCSLLTALYLLLPVYIWFLWNVSWISENLTVDGSVAIAHKHIIIVIVSAEAEIHHSQTIYHSQFEDCGQKLIPNITFNIRTSSGGGEFILCPFHEKWLSVNTVCLPSTYLHS